MNIYFIFFNHKSNVCCLSTFFISKFFFFLLLCVLFISIFYQFFPISFSVVMLFISLFFTISFFCCCCSLCVDVRLPFQRQQMYIYSENEIKLTSLEHKNRGMEMRMLSAHIKRFELVRILCKKRVFLTLMCNKIIIYFSTCNFPSLLISSLLSREEKCLCVDGKWQENVG